MKKEFPNWLDIAPKLPMLLNSYLKNQNDNLNRSVEKNLKRSIHKIRVKQDRISNLLIILILVLLIISIYFF